MKKLITYIKDINKLLQQNKIEEAKKEAKQLKKIFPEDDVVDFIEYFLSNLLLNKVIEEKNYKDIKVEYRHQFYLYTLIKGTKYIENLLEKKLSTNNLEDLPLENIEDANAILIIQLSIISFILFDLSINNKARLKTTLNSLFESGFTRFEISFSLNLFHQKFNTEWLEEEIKENYFLNFYALFIDFHIGYIENFSIKNYFSIDNIELQNLEKKKEIYFLGENGDGKTILLQAILLAIRGNTGNETIFSYINQNENFQKQISNKTQNKLSLSAKVEMIKKLEFNINHKEQKLGYKNIFAYGVNRLRKSDKEPDKEGYLTLFDSDVYLTSPTQWLKDIQLDYLNYEDKKAKKQLKKDNIKPISPEKAKLLLEQVVNFEQNKEKFKVEINGTDIKFKEKGATLEFEQLSDGYKSILILLSDLLSRLIKNQPSIQNIKYFSGIVLIDELGVFLHPKWEFSIASNLRQLFPNIQWVFSTHSPIAILGASKDAIFYKLYKEKAKTKISKPFSPKTFSNKLLSGFVTSPLFNMPTAKPLAYKSSKHDFETGDYIYSIIHKEVKKRLEKEPLQDKEIKNIVKNLLNEFEKESK